jgi:polyhydroxyalkanoate synthesis regulator phasin
MVDAIEQEYDEESDLGRAIDERLRMGAVAGKIQVAQTTANTLLKLLIDKGILTSEEFVEIIQERRKTLQEIVEKTKLEVPDASQEELNDTQRYLEAITEGFNAICEKLSEK